MLKIKDMNRFLVVLFALLLFTACDDGDIIVTDFDFDSDSSLKMCKSGKNNVLYIVNRDPDEAIVFNFEDEDFDGTHTEDTESVIWTISLGGKNALIYRAFDAPVDGGKYFCTGIPPTEPKVITEFQNIEGGRIELISTLIEEEFDEIDNTSNRTFEIRAIAKDITLKNVAKEEEIVRETLLLGFFTKKATIEL